MFAPSLSGAASSAVRVAVSSAFKRTVLLRGGVGGSGRRCVHSLPPCFRSDSAVAVVFAVDDTDKDRDKDDNDVKAAPTRVNGGGNGVGAGGEPRESRRWRRRMRQRNRLADAATESATPARRSRETTTRTTTRTAELVTEAACMLRKTVATPALCACGVGDASVVFAGNVGGATAAATTSRGLGRSRRLLSRRAPRASAPASASSSFSLPLPLSSSSSSSSSSWQAAPDGMALPCLHTVATWTRPSETYTNTWVMGRCAESISGDVKGGIRRCLSSSSSSSSNASECARVLSDLCSRSCSASLLQPSLSSSSSSSEEEEDNNKATQSLMSDLAGRLSPSARSEIITAAAAASAATTATPGSLSPSPKSAAAPSPPTIATDAAPAPAPPSSPASSANDTAATDNTTVDTPEEPSRRDLRLVALNQSIPFVGFGIMDNAILIWAGDVIDSYLGVLLGISTLCAAAIGNIVSDLAGVGLGTIIEDACSKLNVPQPTITSAQRSLRSVRFANQIGIAAGLTVGCIIGMFPLLFIDTRKNEKLKEGAHLEQIFKDMVTESKDLVGAQHACLYTVVSSTDETLPPPRHSDRSKPGAGTYVYGRYMANASVGVGVGVGKGGGGSVGVEKVGGGGEGTSKGGGAAATGTVAKAGAGAGTAKTVPAVVAVPSVSITGAVKPKDAYAHFPLKKGILAMAVRTGTTVNVVDAKEHPDFDYETDIMGPVPMEQVKSMLYVPVFDAKGNVIAIIKALNKVSKGSASLNLDATSESDTDSGLDGGGTTTTTTIVGENDGWDESQGFTHQDIRVLRALATHVSVSLENLNNDDDKVTLRDTIRILKEHGSSPLDEDDDRTNRGGDDEDGHGGGGGGGGGSGSGVVVKARRRRTLAL